MTKKQTESCGDLSAKELKALQRQISAAETRLGKALEKAARKAAKTGKQAPRVRVPLPPGNVVAPPVRQPSVIEDGPHLAPPIDDPCAFTWQQEAIAYLNLLVAAYDWVTAPSAATFTAYQTCYRAWEVAWFATEYCFMGGVWV